MDNMNFEGESLDLRALHSLGELLAAEGEKIAIVAVGGYALILQGIVQRATQDIDIIALGRNPDEEGPGDIGPAEPVPEVLSRAIARIARDYGLPADWMNTVVSMQWKTGLPPGFEERIHWTRYGGLWFGVADRYDLLFLKLFAAADSGGPDSVHFQDLLALNPTNRELEDASEWVRSQDTSTQFKKIVEQVVDHVRKSR
ncbi:MAG: DUF6036 family nucleotidyltransferase [Anaerolineales bacterium]|nr:DUF6036 family nucleotidyltransferase [Anaerolineales bacterium]